MVDVRQVELIGQALQREQILVRHLGRGEDPDLLGPVAPERGAERGECRIPGGRDGATRFPGGRRGEPGLVVDPAEAVAARVADPPLVDLGILARLDPGHPLALVVMRAPAARVDLDIAPAGAAIAHRLGRVEVPDAHLEPEVAVGERAHRADVDHVARVLVLEGLAGEEADLGVIPAVEDAELAGARDLVAEPDAARAQDAALRVEDDMRPQRHGLGLVHLLVGHPRIVEAVAHVVDLQPALARLVADRAVERVVDQVELHDGAPRLHDPLRLRVDDHAVGHRHVAADLGARHLVDVHHAQPALPGDAEPGVIAVVGHLGPGLFRRLEDARARGDLDLHPVDRQLRHGRRSG